MVIIWGLGVKPPGVEGFWGCLWIPRSGWSNRDLITVGCWARMFNVIGWRTQDPSSALCLRSHKHLWIWAFVSWCELQSHHKQYISFVSKMRRFTHITMCIIETRNNNSKVGWLCVDNSQLLISPERSNSVVSTVNGQLSSSFASENNSMYY